MNIVLPNHKNMHNVLKTTKSWRTINCTEFLIALICEKIPSKFLK